ncbi:MAG: pimeloyl-ACP methyl esterase BioG family protein [Desulforhopalus sp.]
MKTSWLHKGGHSSLVVFCNGWGMDRHPFHSLMSSEYDVFMLYDYRQLSNCPDIEAIADNYNTVVLVGWSMGVWIGQKLFSDKHHLFHRTIAINGTLCPIDDSFGIPEKVFNATLAGFCESARLKFYKRMCREKKNLQVFLDKQPQRSVEEQREELATLKIMVDCTPAVQSIYNEIIVSEHDWVMPSANQMNYWHGHPVIPVSGFHFLFNLWQSWDHLLAFCHPASQL